jgi:hypothetical protein
MLVFVGFDDTDTRDSDRGTGKLARWFEQELPDDCRLKGVVRQQLLVDAGIPYTSHNSSACVIVDTPDASLLDCIVKRAVEHVERYFLAGSDPGICVACEGDPSLSPMVEFGLACTRRIVTQKEALRVASNVHLSGHGGTNDGIIGAAAAVGLTASGRCGRFIEFGRLRDFSDTIRVSALEEKNIQVIAIDRDARVPRPEDFVLTNGWIRPRLLGHQAILMVRSKGEGVWENIAQKKHKQQTQ